LKICFAASEVAPFAKTGGLADVAAALPRQLHRLGHDVRLFMPLHSTIDGSGQPFRSVEFVRDVRLQLGPHGSTFSLRTTTLPHSDLAVYLVDCPELFRRSTIYTSAADEARRFAFFSRAVIESCQRMGWGPDAFHCNDWHTGLLPLLLKTVYRWDALFGPSKTLLTIHNVGYQGVFGASEIEALGLGAFRHLFDEDDLRRDRMSFLRTGLIYADALTTVSPTYAREIQTEAYGMGLASLLRARSARLIGILNGVDYDEWSPEKDRFIPHRYSRRRLEGKRKNKRHLQREMGLPEDTDPPLLGVVSRLTGQKGFELCSPVLPELLATSDLRLVALGSGERRYEELFAGLQRRFPRRVVYYHGYNNELAHLIEAGADMFLMPSRYEPCGLNQMFSMRYGTVPIVRKTGGLADSVSQFDEDSDTGTGVVFDHHTPDALRWALQRALELYRRSDTWLRLVRNAMAQDYSWEKQAERYVRLYTWLAGRSYDKE
jgi:starch synthase